MQFDKFMKYVAENIKEYLPPQYRDAEVSIAKAVKNNDITLNSLCIVGEHKTTPSIYLEQFYAQYLFGMPIGEVMEYIADTYLSSFRPDINFTAKDFTYEKVKDNIGVSVCNAAKNEKLLQDVPHEINGDFALTYHVKVKLEDQGEGVIQIHNLHLDLWGIDENTLREVAWQNMEHRFPYQLSDVHDMVEAEFDVSRLPEYSRRATMYMLSNPARFHGAAYMFDRKALSDIAEKFKADMLVIPLSVHECVLLKSDEIQDLDELKEMVEFMYNTKIRPEHALTDDIYLFDCQEQTLSKLDSTQSQEQGMTQQM